MENIKVRVIEKTKRRVLSPKEMCGLDVLAVPTWVFRTENGVRWANIEALSNDIDISSSTSSPSGSKRSSFEDETSSSLKFHAQVEHNECTVHVIGPRNILLKGQVKIKGENDNDIVTLVISPIKYKNKNATLVHHVATFKQNEFEINSLDTPMDLILRMLTMVSNGEYVPAVHASVVKETIISGGDIYQPIILSKFNQDKSIMHLQHMTNTCVDKKEKETNPQLTYDNKNNDEFTFDTILPVNKISTEFLKDVVSDWEFDGFHYDKICEGKILPHLCLHLFRVHNIIDELDIDENKLWLFLLEVNKGYNPACEYHNAIHAASVLHLINMIMIKGKVIERISNNRNETLMILLSMFIGASIHDLEHRGVSNNFLIDTFDSLAVLYNDMSPHEHHHSASTFKLLMTDEFNFIHKFSKDMLRTFRKNVVEMVLNTDMHHHFPLLTKFKMRSSTSPLWKDNFSDVLLVMQISLKIADLSHLTYSFNLHHKWTMCITEENFKQGDKEKILGLPISPLCDRNDSDIAPYQLDFFKYIVNDIFDHFAREFKECSLLKNKVKDNYNVWTTMNTFK